MGRIYNSLLIRVDGVWTIQFGDYSKSVVEQERRDSYSDIPRKDWKIISTGDSQYEIEHALAQLNVGQH